MIHHCKRTPLRLTGKFSSETREARRQRVTNSVGSVKKLSTENPAFRKAIFQK